MNKSGIDILNLEWSSGPSRDRQMATLVCNYLRYMGYSVIEGSLFNGYSLIDKHHPKLLFITNSTGAPENYKIVKFAHLQGIQVVSLVSEGNFSDDEDYLPGLIWGWNKEKILYEDLSLYWSERTVKMALKTHPELQERLKTTGGVGFDIYKINNQFNTEAFLTKYNKKHYSKVVGVGCWDFGPCYEGDHRYEMHLKLHSLKQLELFRKDQSDFQKILKRLIEKHPDILFLLKEHPGVIHEKKDSGIEGLDGYSNTLVLKNEEGIIDCIKACDVWLVYNSTTALEAWLIGKQTGLLNPSGTEFLRDEIYKGSPNYADFNSMESALLTYYKSGFLPGFSELSSIRNKIVKDVIEWDDGLNHVRAGNEIISVLKRPKTIRKQKIPLSLRLERLKQKLLWKFCIKFPTLPGFRFYYENQKKFITSELENFQQMRYRDQLAFYQNLDLNKDKMLTIRGK